METTSGFSFFNFSTYLITAVCRAKKTNKFSLISTRVTELLFTPPQTCVQKLVLMCAVKNIGGTNQPFLHSKLIQSQFHNFANIFSQTFLIPIRNETAHFARLFTYLRPVSQNFNTFASLEILNGRKIKYPKCIKTSAEVE